MREREREREKREEKREGERVYYLCTVCVRTNYTYMHVHVQQYESV
jgi:hypothetical protein